MTLIDPSQIKTSDFPANFVPAGSIPFACTDYGDEDCTVVGFFDPVTREMHIQEVRYAP